MDVPGYVTQLQGEGDRVAVVLADADLDAPVPSCPDWCLRDLVHHLGGVHQWATAFVRAEPDQPEGGDLEDIVGGWPADDDLESWFVKGHRHLVAAIEQAPADLDTWTFLDAPSPLVFWARRQAHETAIHRLRDRGGPQRTPPRRRHERHRPHLRPLHLAVEPSTRRRIARRWRRSDTRALARGGADHLDLGQ